MRTPPQNRDAYAEKLAQRVRLKDQRETNAHRVASAAASFDKTDPFTYDRIFSRIINGVGEEFSFGTKP